MRSRRAAILIGAIVLGIALPAAAVEVYINGVRVTGVRDQEFDDVSVRLDSKGNVHITAPRYRVERVDTEDGGPAGTKTTKTTGPGKAPATVTKTTPTPTKVTPPTKADSPPAGGGAGLSRRYWLVAQTSAPGQVQYRIQVRINGRLVRTFDDAAVPPPVEVTDFLRPGRNAVRIVADKITEGGRRSTSSRHWLRVVVADGHIEGTSVVIDHPGVIMTRTAAHTDGVSREFTLQAQ